jgi:AcrR family transcriptional regulator
LKLHGKTGIFGTSWADIAAEADVALATVYRHFPTLDDLVSACGDMLMERTRPPAPEDADALLNGVTDTVERLRRVARHLFAFFTRGGSHLESDLRERELPAVQEWEAYLRATVRSLVCAALGDTGAGAGACDQIAFLFDRQTFWALRDRGIGPDDASETVARMAAAFLGLGPGPRGPAAPD